MQNTRAGLLTLRSHSHPTRRRTPPTKGNRCNVRRIHVRSSERVQCMRKDRIGMVSHTEKESWIKDLYRADLNDVRRVVLRCLVPLQQARVLQFDVEDRRHRARRADGGQITKNLKPLGREC